MQFKIAFLSFLVSLIFSAFASAAPAGYFDGLWSGRGMLTTPEYRHMPCQDLTYDLRHTAQTFSFQFGNISCGNFHANQEPMTFVIRGNALLFRGRNVGTISGNYFRIDFVDDHGVREVISLTLTANGLTYREEEYDYSGFRFFALDGQLYRRR